jgi:hypothetical protein
MKLMYTPAGLRKVAHLCHDIECESMTCKVAWMFKNILRHNTRTVKPYPTAVRYEVQAWTCSFCESCIPGTQQICDICDTPAGPASIPVRVIL